MLKDTLGGIKVSTKVQTVTDQSEMVVEDKVWLGIIYSEKVRFGHTLITPLAFSENNRWQSVTFNDCYQYFPNNGKVVIFKEVLPFQINRLCLFYPEVNQRLVDPEELKYSHYMTREIQIPLIAQIFDWTSKARDPFELPDLLDQGLEIKDCICQYIYICYKDHLYGPIKVEIDDGCFRPTEYIHSNSAGGQKLLVSVYKMPTYGILKLGDDSRSFHCLNENILASPIDQVDWSLSQVIIKQVLQARKSIDNKTVEKINLVDKSIRELAQFNSHKGPDVLHIEQATLQRAHYMVQHQLKNVQEVQSLFEDLPANHPQLKVAIEQEIQRQMAAIQHEAEQRVQPQIAEHQKIQSEIQQAEAQLEKTKAAIAEAERKYEQLQVQINHPVQHQSMIGNSIDWHSDDHVQGLHGDLSQLQRKFWIRRATQAGIVSDAMLAPIAALLAGFVPIVNHSIANALLYIIGQAITNNRVWSVPVPMTAITPLDLFGHIEGGKQVFIPAAGGLADIVLQARRHPEELALVLLEGIDRVPGMPVYAPLLQQYQANTETHAPLSQRAPLNLFHPRTLAPDDPYREMAWFSWPRNLLLMATRDKSLTSLPMPACCEAYVIHLERLNQELTNIYRQQDSIASSHVSLSQWQQWRQNIWNDVNSNNHRKELSSKQETFIQIVATLQVNDNEMEAMLKRLWPKQLDDAHKKQDTQGRH